jgi:hypothetical protein
MIQRANLLLVRLVKSLGRRAHSFRRVMRATASRARFAVGVRPLSYRWGFDRGNPVHRYYVDCFLQKHALDIRGHCMELCDHTLLWEFATSAGHIRGLVVTDFTHDELMHQDEHFPVEVCGRAVKSLSIWKA